jgi:hypothetical protein
MNYIFTALLLFQQAVQKFINFFMEFYLIYYLINYSANFLKPFFLKFSQITNKKIIFLRSLLFITIITSIV